MAKLTITRGLPGAGKTTWAKEQADAVGTVRVNRDELRLKMFGKRHGLSFEDEDAVTRASRGLAHQWLAAGLDVVADDTNLRPRYVREWSQLAKEWGADFEVKEFPMTVDEAVSRQLLRPEAERVPAQAIQRLGRFLKNGVGLLPWEQEPVEPWKPTPYTPDPNLPPAVIVDIDGTVALMQGRDPYDYSRVSEDLPNLPVIELVDILREVDVFPVFMSGRDDSCEADTRAWLLEHVFGYGGVLHMRKTGDSRPDNIVKAEMFDQHVRGTYNVQLVLDDRNSVVKMWRDMGLTCLQVQDGDF